MELPSTSHLIVKPQTASKKKHKFVYRQKMEMSPEELEEEERRNKAARSIQKAWKAYRLRCAVCLLIDRHSQIRTVHSFAQKWSSAPETARLGVRTFCEVTNIEGDTLESPARKKSSDLEEPISLEFEENGIIWGNDPFQLIAATSSHLLQLVTSPHPDFSKHNENFVEDFLMTFPTIVSNDQLLELLALRFSTTHDTKIKERVALFINLWIIIKKEDFAEESTIRKKLEKFLREESFTETTDLIKYQRTIHKRLSVDYQKTKQLERDIRRGLRDYCASPRPIVSKYDHDNSQNEKMASLRRGFKTFVERRKSLDAGSVSRHFSLRRRHHYYEDSPPDDNETNDYEVYLNPLRNHHLGNTCPSLSPTQEFYKVEPTNASTDCICTSTKTDRSSETYKSTVRYTSQVRAKYRSNNITTIFDASSLEIARQTTLIQKSLFDKILVNELLFHSRSKADSSPNVAAFINHFNELSHWVAYQIVSLEEKSSRVSALDKFISISHHCFKLNNFTGAMAIITGLACSSVSRLKKSWGNVSKKRIEQYIGMQERMSHVNNWKEYRSLLSTINGPCIPFFAVTMHDLTFIDDGNKNKIPNDDRVMLHNWEKRALMAKCIREAITKWQAEFYQLRPVYALQDFLANMPQVDFEKIYQLSLKQEPRAIDNSTEFL